MDYSAKFPKTVKACPAHLECAQGGGADAETTRKQQSPRVLGKKVPPLLEMRKIKFYTFSGFLCASDLFRRLLGIRRIAGSCEGCKPHLLATIGYCSGMHFSKSRRQKAAEYIKRNKHRFYLDFNSFNSAPGNIAIASGYHHFITLPSKHSLQLTITLLPQHRKWVLQ